MKQAEFFTIMKIKICKNRDNCETGGINYKIKLDFIKK